MFITRNFVIEGLNKYIMEPDELNYLKLGMIAGLNCRIILLIQ